MLAVVFTLSCQMATAFQATTRVIPSSLAAPAMPAVRVKYTDGITTDLWNEVSTATTQTLKDGNSLTRHLFADKSGLISLCVCKLTYAEFPVIEQWIEVKNGKDEPIVLEKFESSSLIFEDELWLRYYTGKWNNELNPLDEKITKPYSLKTKRGVRVNERQPSFFFLSEGSPMREKEGLVFAGALVWNSNFAFNIAPTANGVTTHCGINPDGSHYTLDQGKTFTSPRMLWIWSNNGVGELSRNMHRFIVKNILRDGDKPRAVLLNNWEATTFNFNETVLTNLFDGAQKANFDLFLLDDGWFGKGIYARNKADAGLGDWVANPQKLPHGVKYLCDEAKKRDLRFGIWIEPEMVNPKSELYKKHPDWVFSLPGETLKLIRRQAVLDLIRPEAFAYVFKAMDDLFTQNPGISYAKWDCNSFIPQPGSSWLATDRQQNLFIDHANAVDNLMQRLVKKHPDVEMMVCAGGGGRTDLRSLRHFHEFWPSDNTDPVRRVTMQWDYSYLYPAISIAAHVTHMGKRPLKFAFDVAMSARLGADLDLRRMSQENRDFIAAAVATYKRDILSTVQFGELFRLESPYTGPRSVINYVTTDKSTAVLFVFQLKDASPKPVCLEGLDPKSHYLVSELNLTKGSTSALAENGKILSGESLMQTGLVPTCNKAIESMIIKCEQVKKSAKALY